MQLRKIIAVTAMAMVFCACASWAQDQDQQQSPLDNPPQAPIQPSEPADTNDGAPHQVPVPAARGLFGADTQTLNTSVPDDTHALTGAEVFGVGNPAGTHNLFDFALHTSLGGDTGIVPHETNVTGQAGGLATWNHSWDRYQFTGQYAGGYMVYSPASVDNMGFQSFSAEQIIRWRRATLRLRDDFVQSSGAAFGGLSTGGPGLTMPVGIVATTSPTFVSNQSILTGQVDRIGDNAVGEVDYALSRRSMLTFDGSYGLLHFLKAGYINSQSELGRVGYGYELSRKNSVGVIYDYEHVTFSGNNGAVTTDVLQGTFGRRLTGRTALQIAAGPQLVFSNALGAAATTSLSWTLLGKITHQVRRTTYSASYTREVTSGSGVLLGAQTQTASASVATLFHRWTPSVSGGYAFNSSLANSVKAAGAFQYSNWFGIVNFGRLWDHLVQTNFSYELQRQTETVGTCPVLNCGTAFLRQVFSVTVDLHIRPVGFE